MLGQAELIASRGRRFSLFPHSSTRAAIIPHNLVQLAYRSKPYEGHSKDFEFSRPSMEEHWPAGYHDAVRTLRHPEALQRLRNREGVYTFDLAVDGRE